MNLEKLETERTVPGMPSPDFIVARGNERDAASVFSARHFTRWFTCIISIGTHGDLVRSEILFPFPSDSEFLRLGAAHPGDGGARFLNPGGFAESHLPTIPPAGQGWRTRIRSPPLQRTGRTKALVLF